ncbi:MAG: phosphate ABC transporter permease subunit PstC, partial [Dehalococcoidia bacterium]
MSFNAAAGYSKRAAALGRDMKRDMRERVVAGLLLLAASVSALTTFGILFSLAGDTIRFFQRVSIVEFLTGTQWTPLFSVQRFGIWP